MEYRTQSIQQLISELKRHPMLSEMSLETIISYVIDFFQLVGVPAAQEEKVCKLELNNYRAKLPDDYMDIIQVRTTGNPPMYYRYAGDTFHYSDNKAYSSPLTYKIQNDYIFTSEESGEIEVAYTAMDIDECGFPLIPDDVKYTRALKAYIKKQWFDIQFDLGKIPQQVIEKADQDYCWAVGALESSGNKMSLDKAETLLNMAKNIFIPNGLHQKGYSTSGDKVMLKVK